MSRSSRSENRFDFFPKEAASDPVSLKRKFDSLMEKHGSSTTKDLPHLQSAKNSLERLLAKRKGLGHQVRYGLSKFSALLGGRGKYAKTTDLLSNYHTAVGNRMQAAEEQSLLEKHFGSRYLGLKGRAQETG